MNTPPLRDARFYISLSIAAAVATITLKLFAWWISGSVGLLSDALESFVNLVGASFALWMIQIASAPPDADHPYGHSKAEYFSSGFEGMLIFAAAALILWSAIPRLLTPAPLESLGLGLWLSAGSTALNFMVSRLLSRAGQRLHSVALEADARHLMTDVWTTLGVIAGLIAVALTGWLWLDALIAIGVALHILFEGWKLMRTATGGLMDESLPDEDLGCIDRALSDFRAQGASFLHLKTRRAGSTRFVHLTVQVPGDWRVDVAHDLLDRVEARIADVLQGAQVSTHLEPLRNA
ncbi:MAG: cation diffusion facilitator family transporter [Rhodocyclaceae bacterium]